MKHGWKHIAQVGLCIFGIFLVILTIILALEITHEYARLFTISAVLIAIVLLLLELLTYCVKINCQDVTIETGINSYYLHQMPQTLSYLTLILMAGCAFYTFMKFAIERYRTHDTAQCTTYLMKENNQRLFILSTSCSAALFVVLSCILISTKSIEQYSSSEKDKDDAQKEGVEV